MPSSNMTHPAQVYDQKIIETDEQMNNLIQFQAEQVELQQDDNISENDVVDKQVEMVN